MTDLTEKNLEAALLNLTTTDTPVSIKPTTWFGNPAKTAQWYKCPNCAKQSPLTREWVGLTDDEKQTAVWTDGSFGSGALWAEAKLKEKNT